MDLAKLLETEAEAEIKAVLAEAQSKADLIVKTASDKAQAFLENQKRLLEAEHQAAMARAKSAAELESASLKLSGSHSMIEKAFKDAENELKAFTNSHEYVNTLAKLISEAKHVLGSIERLEVNSKDLGAAEEAIKLLGLKITIRANPSVETGIRAVSINGQTSVMNTLIGRLVRSREALMSEVTRLLEG